ncbi:hypothetical protein [Akkermansia muciniphila]|uniref:hypothetical protein n=1 Tax=Akkermansia muciniphila TaxID=239935 RepID=UPI00068E7050|nr:hypothetical protein [Akkermansia muciniphila]
MEKRSPVRGPSLGRLVRRLRTGERWSPPGKENAGNAADTSPYTVPPESAERRGRVNQLIRAYRVMGHQCARFNPLAPPDQTGCPVNPEDMGFREEDMDQPVNIGTFMDGGTFTLREIITGLQKNLLWSHRI